MRSIGHENRSWCHSKSREQAFEESAGELAGEARAFEGIE